MFFKRKKKEAPAPDPAPRKEVYEFIVRSEDEKTDRALVKYQKLYTDKEDKYNGMKLMEFKKEGCPGDKVYEYPPLDVDVTIEPVTDEDGTLQIRVYLITGLEADTYVGTAAKTKAKKILRILEEKSPYVTAELYGGRYWKMEDSGYVNNDWSEDLTVRVYLSFLPEK